MRSSVVFLSLLLVLSSSVNGQVREYAEHIVQILAFDSLFGRGYVFDGDKKAAEFIKQEFMRVGVQPIAGSYFQPFEIPINTFPDSIHISIDENHLEPGIDFHVYPGSPPVNGTFEIVYVPKEEIFQSERLQEKLILSRDKILVIDEYPDSLMDAAKRNRWNKIEQFLTRHPNNPAALTILLTSEKLTWFGSQVVDSNPSIRLKKELFNVHSRIAEVHLPSEFIQNYPTQNVIGKINGYESDSTIVVMAHYDHFGMMGQAIFPGANDNASGVAMMLSLAEFFSTSPSKHTIVFIAFGAEELGLIGSKYFVENPPIDLAKVKFVLNFDLAGTGDEGIQVVNGSIYKDNFDRLVELNHTHKLLPNVRIRGAACNSDHCNFDRVGIPGFYIYTLGGIRAYHDVFDRPETLPLTAFEDYFNLMRLFIEQF